MAQTSVPVKLLAAPWLDETFELPVAQSNKVWHQGLQVTEVKKCQWLDRVDGRFKAKARNAHVSLELVESLTPLARDQVKQTVSGGKAPSLQNFAYRYRDAEKDQELVWRACCMWVDCEHERRLAWPSQEELEAKNVDFNRGAMDASMLERCRALDPGFQHSDWRFIRVQQQAALCSWTPDALSNVIHEAGLVSTLPVMLECLARLVQASAM